MTKVIKGFRDTETQQIYKIGDTYEGDRGTELVDLGYLQPKEIKAKKAKAEK